MTIKFEFPSKISLNSHPVYKGVFKYEQLTLSIPYLIFHELQFYPLHIHIHMGVMQLKPNYKLIYIQVILKDQCKKIMSINSQH